MTIANDTTDYTLAQMTVAGDIHAFEQLYERHNRRVYSLCLRMTNNSTDAEDLTQEVFVQVFRKISSFRGQAAFTTWLHRLTVNQVLMHFRKRGVRLEKTTEEGDTPEQVVMGTENHRTMPIIDRIALNDAIAQLPPGYRLVFTLHDIEGREHEEIAAMLGRSVGTSKSQLHKARMRLRSLLKRRNQPASAGNGPDNQSIKKMKRKKTNMSAITAVTSVEALSHRSPPCRNLGWHWALVISTVLFLGLSAQGQTVEPNKSPGADKSQTVNIEQYLDRLIANSVVAGEAAGVIQEADEYRTQANQKLKAGRPEEARVLLRRAGEIIAAAAPEGDAKQQDPLLREYLRDITKELVALDSATQTFSSETINGSIVGNHAGQPRVAAFLTYFQGRGRSRLETGRSRLAPLRPVMAQIFREEGVPEWLLSVGFVESTYNANAHSPAQAHGIWQFIPGTGQRYGLKQTAWADERSHPEKSTRAAARYLRDLHALFGDWLLALAAYNWGEGRVAKVTQRTGIRDFWTLANRGLLPQETTNYVPSVLAASQLLFRDSREISGAQAPTTDPSQRRRVTTSPQDSGEQAMGRQ